MANINTPFKDLPDNILFNYNDFKEHTPTVCKKVYDSTSGDSYDRVSTINYTSVKTVKSSSIKRRLTRDRLGFSL